MVGNTEIMFVFYLKMYEEFFTWIFMLWHFYAKDERDFASMARK